ncbi:MAG: PepSY-like domain-containing protein [Chitinophagaceae bacterium]|nr:PepSY-like domain-containing protein [Chitinophagaceae bacterium]
MKNKILTLVVFILFGQSLFAQIREIPKIVEETFANQYPSAENVEFKDLMVKVQVHFEWKGDKMMATYSNKGLWKGTEKAWTYDSLPEDVKDGFKKSKFGDESWEVEETVQLDLPGGSQQYRILVAKSDVQKKYLFFNTGGRLLRTSVTL